MSVIVLGLRIGQVRSVPPMVSNTFIKNTLFPQFYKRPSDFDKLLVANHSLHCNLGS